ncbi:Uncharacterised protein [Yersinia massiliensis]|uniref:hypothetical protein n=1 Tax=Yersinia massiliensis TaxID=419257 RepID=UPI0005DDB406|nr:hypothetical protein [Yersinia massiliensis]CNI20644.1 Uncharacterised protein [Yersinia massiliensis]
MYKNSIQARREIARNFTEINYDINPLHWQTLRMGINRDLQAQKLRPNVPVPLRRKAIPFLKLMHKETGSMLKAILAFGFDGPWTSSGGSFRLAREIGFDINHYAKNIHHKNGSVTFLEIGAAWAGFHAEGGASHQSTISGLAESFRDNLGKSVFLHFTNLTPWHDALPTGVTEHPYVTAAGLGALEKKGLQAGEVNIIYSQAAAYFEQDFTAFLRSAARLLKSDGVLIFNHDPILASKMDDIAWEHGLHLVRRKQVGGMNGAIARYHRLRSPAVSHLPLPGVSRAQENELVCKSLVMSALRRSAEV